MSLRSFVIRSFSKNKHVSDIYIFNKYIDIISHFQKSK